MWADGGAIQIEKKKHKKSGVSLTHGKWGAIEDLVGEEKPIEHYVSRSQSSVQGNQNLPGLLHTGPVLGNGKGEKADSVPISRGQTASITWPTSWQKGASGRLTEGGWGMYERLEDKWEWARYGAKGQGIYRNRNSFARQRQRKWAG